MPTGAWRGPAWALLVGLACAARTASARDDEGPRVVTLSEGLGIRLSSGWYWICPSAFGQELAPPAQSVDGKRTFVVGENDLFVLESDGAVVAQSRPDLSRQSVVELALLGDRIFALRSSADASDIVALDAPDAGPIWGDTAAYQSISPDGDSLWVARVAGTVGYLVRLGPDGSTRETLTFAVNPGDRPVRVQRVGGAAYLNMVTSMAGGTLSRLDADSGTPALVLSSPQPISGPVTTGGTSAWAVSDTLLQTIGQDAAAPVSTGYAVSCVAGSAGAAVLCAGTRLLGLAPAGPQGELFRLASLVGPAPFPDAGPCAADWEVFRWDLSRAGVTVLAAPDGGSGTAPAAATSSGCGCSVEQRPTWTWRTPVTLLALLLARRWARRFQRASL
jgi:hypothetical protein